MNKAFIISYMLLLFAAPAYAAHSTDATPSATSEFADALGARIAAEHGDAKAFADLKSRAIRGEATYQYDLGAIYDDGVGAPKDVAEALRWFRKAADQGLAIAQFTLGSSYISGHGLPQDYAEAAKWYRRAAAQGFVMAQYDLGILSYGGLDAAGLKGVKQDYVEAYFWLSLAVKNDREKISSEINMRDKVAALLSPEQKAAADKRVAEWNPIPTPAAVAKP